MRSLNTIYLIGAGGIVALSIFLYLILKHSPKVYIFAGIQGPKQVSVLPSQSPTPIQRYQTGNISRLAVLISDPNSSWLSLAHGLKTIGIPFLMTQDYKEALVLVYPYRML